jgi:hypothetical protein
LGQKEEVFPFKIILKFTLVSQWVVMIGGSVKLSACVLHVLVSCYWNLNKIVAHF